MVRVLGILVYNKPVEIQLSCVHDVPIVRSHMLWNLNQLNSLIISALKALGLPKLHAYLPFRASIKYKFTTLYIYRLLINPKTCTWAKLNNNFHEFIFVFFEYILMILANQVKARVSKLIYYGTHRLSASYVSNIFFLNINFIN